MNTHGQNQATSIASYTGNARFNSRHCAALAIQLHRVAPAGMSGDQASALALIVTRAAEVDLVRKTRSRTAPSAQRVPRFKVVSAWAAVKDGLGATATIPPELGSEGQEAQTLGTRLFPEGSSFTQLDAVAVWSQSKELLERLDEEGLSPRVNALIHPKLLAAATRAYEQLGQAIGVVGEVIPTPPSRALAEANKRFAFAVSSYARALSVSVTLEDHATLQRFLDALAPMDAMRVTAAAGEEDEEVDSEGGDQDVEEKEEQPALPMPTGPINGTGPFTS